jgi:putative peptidoglycan lipid II flippase
MSSSENSLIPQSIRTTFLIGMGVASKLAIDLVIAASFGLSLYTDAFFIAYTLPLVSEALIFQSCQSGMVPLFVRRLSPDQQAEKWSLFSSLFNLSVIVSLVLSMIGFFGAPLLINVLAPGIDPDATKYALATDLMHILFLWVIFVGPVGVMRAFLNAHNRFSVPAMIDLMRGLGVLGTIGLVLAVRGEFDITVVAIGYVVGAFLQFVVLSAAVWRTIGSGYRPVLNWSTLRSARVFRLMSVPFFDYGLEQIILIGERIIGSFLPTGSITAINFGHRLASVFAYLLFSGIEVVSLSSLAANFNAATSTERMRARSTLVTGLRMVSLLGVVVAASVWALSMPIVQVLFERGAFDREATMRAAPIVGVYALSIPFYGFMMLIKNYLFASLQAMRIYVLSATLMIVTVGLGFLLSAQFGAQGVGMAYVGGALAAAGLGLFLLEVEVVRELRRVLTSLGWKILAAAALLVAVMRAVSDFVPLLLGSNIPALGTVGQLSTLLLAGLCGGITLLAVLSMLRVEEVTLLWRFLARYLRRA